MPGPSSSHPVWCLQPVMRAGVMSLQMLGGLGQGGPAQLGSGQGTSRVGNRSGRGVSHRDEFVALSELPPDEAELWRQRIL